MLSRLIVPDWPNCAADVVRERFLELEHSVLAKVREPKARATKANISNKTSEAKVNVTKVGHCSTCGVWGHERAHCPENQVGALQCQ